MKILVSEAVEVIFHQHNIYQSGWSEGRFGRSYRFHDNMTFVKSDTCFDDEFKIYQQANGFIVYVDGKGYEGSTVKEAVDASFEEIGGTPTFEFKIGA